MGKGVGFGKTILFGEHFVIYNTLGIIAALELKTEAQITMGNSKGIHIEDLRSGAMGYIESKKEMQEQSLTRILKHIDLHIKDFKIRLSGDLPAFSGIGASGASCVAIVRAISDEINLDLNDERVNEAAYEGEKAYHGENTAGIDNIASTYGGVICFEKGSPPCIDHIQLQEPVEIVIADTGIVANTEAMIEGVSIRKNDNKKKYNYLILEANNLFKKGQRALLKFELDTVGRLMNENHQLLQEIEVSSKELDHLVNLARSKGALGAKQTGSGGGGCIVALTPGIRLQEDVAGGLEQEGFSVLRTRIGF